MVFLHCTTLCTCPYIQTHVYAKLLLRKDLLFECNKITVGHFKSLLCSILATIIWANPSNVPTSSFGQLSYLVECKLEFVCRCTWKLQTLNILSGKVYVFIIFTVLCSSMGILHFIQCVKVFHFDDIPLCIWEKWDRWTQILDLGHNFLCK
jgi:hypothetical protein